ncbi:NUDIX domain-containing protein [Candidatus Peregrinibacteria bacterium]|nr:NUDIX domain-containing protein [Candidatus Peregrinibacteria bacterium]
MAETERFRIYIAAYLVLRKKGEILLSRRFNTGYHDGEYSLVAGHLDGGETATQAILREAKEEVGITLKKKDVHVAHIMHRYRKDREYIDIYLTAEQWSGDLQNLEPNKCDDLRWYPVVGLPQTLLPEVRQALHCIETGQFYSEIGWEEQAVSGKL